MEVIRNHSFCRLCLCRNVELHSVFESRTVKGWTAANIIIEFLGVQVSPNDIYPKCVCIECMVKLEDFKLFKQRCESNKELLDRAYATNMGLEPNNEFLSNHVDNGREHYIKKEEAEISMERDNLNLNESSIQIKTEIEDGCNDSNVFYSTEAIESGDQVSIQMKTEYEDHINTPHNSSTEAMESNEEIPEMNVTCEINFMDKSVKQEVVDIPTESYTRQSFEEGVPPVSSDGLVPTTLNNSFNIPPMEEAHLRTSIAHVHGSHCCGITNYEGHDVSEVTYDTGVLNRVDERQFKCLRCDKEFVKKGHLDRHMLTHSVERPYKCTLCNKTFSVKAYLKTHMKTHTGERPFKCDQCCSAFYLKTDLKRHKSTHSGDRPFKCELCGRNFLRRNQLEIHMTIHSEERRHFGINRREDVFPYDTNPEGSVSKEMPFNINDNTETFTYNLNPTVHMASISEDSPLKCDRCGKSFSAKGALRRHEVIHSGDKPFKCTECGKTFSIKSYLKSHMMIHSGERPFKCDQCSSAFSLKSDLNRHKTTHSGDRPFKCQYCSKNFLRRKQLEIHMATHSVGLSV